jgi:ADP-ribose pyrophosphatase YjhB (NUDIX family)
MEKNRKKIFHAFLYDEKLRFSELFRKTKISSSLLAYFLSKMTREGVLSKTNEHYSLSEDGEKLIPFFVPESERVSPLVVLLFFCTRNKEIFLVKRGKRPYRGLWSLPSGRLLISESLEQATSRILAEKYGLRAQMSGFSSVVYERVLDAEKTKHGFIFLVVSTHLDESSKPFFGKWFSLARVPKSKTIASDYWLIQNKRSCGVEVVEETIHVRGKTTRMELV